MKTSQTVILSLGGSLIYPDHGIDIIFLRKLNAFIRKHVALGRRFFIVCGGGNVARYYQDVAKGIINSLAGDDVDWLGIHATRINAHLVRTIFADLAHPRIVENYTKKLKNVNEPIVIAAGWKPGWSTDYCATVLARDYGASTIINMSNIEMLYTKDPNKYSDAKAIPRITWDQFAKYSGDKWVPGTRVPFDPIATKLAAKLGLTVIITNGKNLDNLDNIIAGKKFVGTVIQPFKLEHSFFDRDYYQGYKGANSRFLIRATARPRAFFRAFLISQFMRPKKVLDIGCGLGYFIYYLRRFGVEAYGVEFSDYARNNALPFVREFIKPGDVRSLPFEDNFFDLVTSFDVLEHIPKHEIKKAIAECTRVSKRYQFHKIYTRENIWLPVFHGHDPSHVSVLPRAWWEKIWRAFRLKASSVWWEKLPSAIDTNYLLEKTIQKA